MKEAPLALEEALRIALKLAKALAEVHRANVIHKDVNPANVSYNRQTFEIADNIRVAIADNIRKQMWNTGKTQILYL